ncbi:MAG: M61 family peptidase, partial [Thermoplasmata archaeon]
MGGGNTQILYEVTAEQLRQHRIEVGMHLEGDMGATVDIVLPSWFPGFYSIEDPAKRVRSVIASTRGRGASLPVDRIDKSRWRITTNSARAIEVRLEVYAHELTDAGLDVSEDHLFINAGRCLPYVDGHLEEPHEVVLHLPDPAWRVYTELTEVSNHPPRYRAENYDILVDSPIDCGEPVELMARPSGIPHRILLCGRGGNYEGHRLEVDVDRIASASIRLFGESPLRHYTFFLHIADRHAGGLEHLTSNSCVVERTAFRPESAYARILYLLSHEYFHLYNVKRIHPKVLGPFDYTREVYTRLLWLMEGTTEYYAGLLVRRGQCLPAERYLDRLATTIRDYLRIPGRLVRSAEEASFLSWIDLYHPFEDTPNQSISYYRKGELVSLVLDLE